MKERLLSPNEGLGKWLHLRKPKAGDTDREVHREGADPLGGADLHTDHTRRRAWGAILISCGLLAFGGELLAQSQPAISSNEQYKLVGGATILIAGFIGLINEIARRNDERPK